jgi:hypothetical protein
MNRILLTILAALLVGSLITSAVLAAKPSDGNPVNQIDDIDMQVADILATVTAIEEDTDNLTLEIQSLDTRLEAIEDALGTVSRTETYMGRELTTTASDNVVYVFESDNYTQGAHFHVTLDIATAVETGDYLRVGRSYKDSGGTTTRSDDYSDRGLHTFEFDGYHLKIYYETDGTPGLWFGWGVTVTYTS